MIRGSSYKVVLRADKRKPQPEEKPIDWDGTGTPSVRTRSSAYTEREGTFTIDWEAWNPRVPEEEPRKARFALPRPPYWDEGIRSRPRALWVGHLGCLRGREALEATRQLLESMGVSRNKLIVIYVCGEGAEMFAWFPASGGLYRPVLSCCGKQTLG